MKPRTLFQLALAAIIVTTCFASSAPPPVQAAGVIYVNAAATGAKTGASWRNAFTSLQSALTAAAAGTEIWVASGTYRPTTGTDRSLSFQLKNGVAVYGGFSGVETLRTQRNFFTHITLLDGNLGSLTDVLDNSYHVVVGSGTDATAVLDGFIIQNGKANGLFPHNAGAGMLNEIGSPTLANLLFQTNDALSGGGMENFNGSHPTLSQVRFSSNTALYGAGMCNEVNSSPTLVDVIFISNFAGGGGGGMQNSTGSSPNLLRVSFLSNRASGGGGMQNLASSGPNLTNVIFVGNSADLGGGMENNGAGSPVLTNVTFSSNTAGAAGGGLVNLFSTPVITNTIIWGNTAPLDAGINAAGTSILRLRYSLVQGGCPAAGAACDHVLNVDPLFLRNPSPGADAQWGTADDNSGNLRLSLLSPAVDAGENSAVPAAVTTDFDGNPRFVQIPDRMSDSAHTVDLGPYENKVRIMLPKIFH